MFGDAIVVGNFQSILQVVFSREPQAFRSLWFHGGALNMDHS